MCETESGSTTVVDCDRGRVTHGNDVLGVGALLAAGARGAVGVVPGGLTLAGSALLEMLDLTVDGGSDGGGSEGEEDGDEEASHCDEEGV